MNDENVITKKPIEEHLYDSAKVAKYFVGGVVYGLTVATIFAVLFKLDKE